MTEFARRTAWAPRRLPASRTAIANDLARPHRRPRGFVCVATLAFLTGCTAQPVITNTADRPAEMAAKEVITPGKLDVVPQASRFSLKTMDADAGGTHASRFLGADDRWRPPEAVWVKRQFRSHIRDRHVVILCEVVADRIRGSYGRAAALRICWKDLDELDSSISRLPVGDQAAFRDHVIELRDQVGRQLVQRDLQRAELRIEAGEDAGAIAVLDAACRDWIDHLSCRTTSSLEVAVRSMRERALAAQRLRRAREDLGGVVETILDAPPIDTSTVAGLEQSLHVIMIESSEINTRLLRVLQAAMDRSCEESVAGGATPLLALDRRKADG